MPLRKWHTLQTELLWAYRGRPREIQWEGCESAPTVRAWRIERGGVKLITTCGAAEAHAGQWVLFDTGFRSQVFDDDSILLSLDFKAHWADDTPVHVLDPPVCFAAGGFPYFDTTAESAVRFVEGLGPGAAERTTLADQPATLAQTHQFRRLADRLFASYARVMDALGVAPHVAPEADERVQHAMAILEETLHRPGFSEQALARAAGLSVSQLNRLFVDDTGFTSKQYRRCLRLSQAKRLLAGAALPVKTVAYRLGFRQPSHFTRWFSRHAGETPTSFRASHPPKAGGD